MPGGKQQQLGGPTAGAGTNNASEAVPGERADRRGAGVVLQEPPPGSHLSP